MYALACFVLCYARVSCTPAAGQDQNRGGCRAVGCPRNFYGREQWSKKILLTHPDFESIKKSRMNLKTVSES